MRFPKFLRFYQKIQVERNFLTYFWQVLAFRLPSYKQTKKKTLPDFEGLPGANRWFPHHETGPKKIFCPKTTKYHQDSYVKGPAKFQTVNRSLVVFDPFWPAVPKPLALGALSNGHPKYLFGATKWPPKHYGGASLTDLMAIWKITGIISLWNFVE